MRGGLAGLDWLTGGLQAGDLAVVAGRLRLLAFRWRPGSGDRARHAQERRAVTVTGGADFSEAHEALRIPHNQATAADEFGAGDGPAAGSAAQAVSGEPCLEEGCG